MNNRQIGCLLLRVILVGLLSLLFSEFLRKRKSLAHLKLIITLGVIVKSNVLITLGVNNVLDNTQGFDHINFNNEQIKGTDIDFADDLALMAQRARDMEESFRHLVRHAGRVGLQVNMIKTKLMRINTLSINGISIKETENFCYIGSILAKDGVVDLDVNSRIQKARQAFISLNNIWKSTQLTRNLKLRFFKTNCISVLLYGCET